MPKSKELYSTKTEKTNNLLVRESQHAMQTDKSI